MKHVTVERSDGATLKLKLPERPEEVTLKQFIDFDNLYSKLIANVTKAAKENLMFEKNAGYVINLMAIMRALFPEFEEDFFKLDLSKETNTELVVNMAKLKRETGKDEADLESVLTSFEAVIGHFYRLVYDWEPEMPEGDAYEFTHRGRKFVLPEARQDLVFKKYNFGTVTLDKLVEISHTHKMIKRRAEQNELANKHNEEVENKKDPEGSLAYTKMINTLAMLVDEKGKETPKDPKRFDRAVEDRIKLFENIPMTIARTAAFFLLVTKNI